MKRILEPEVMDTPQEAAEYDAMDFTEVNTAFAEKAIALVPKKATVLDAGTGTARIPIILASQRPEWQITGIDLASSMLELGAKNIQAAGLEKQIVLETIDAKEMPYSEQEFDIVISNSLVHHLPNPLPFLKEVKRVLKPNGAILIRDLLRPQNETLMHQMVAEIGAEYDEHQAKLSITIRNYQSLNHSPIRIAIETNPSIFVSEISHQLFPKLSEGNQALDEALDVFRNAIRVLDYSQAKEALLEILEDCFEGYAIFPGSQGRRDLLNWWLLDVVPAIWSFKSPESLYTIHGKIPVTESDLKCLK